MNTDEARFALKTLDSCIEGVRVECVNAINQWQRDKRLKEDGKCHEDDVHYSYVRARFAMDVLEVLGYEIDYYFCGHVVLKVVE